MLTAFTARPLVELKQRDKSKIESVLAYGDRVLAGLNNGSLRVYRINETSGEDGRDTGISTRTSTSLAEAPVADGAGARDEGLLVGERDREGENGARNGHNNQQDSGRPVTAGSGSDSVKPAAKRTELLREVEKFSKYKVEQLAFIKEAKLLISLSGGYVSIYDLQSYVLQEQLTKTKGASTFAVTSNIVNDPETGVPSIVSRLAVAVKRRILLWSWRDMELQSDTSEMVLASGIKTLTWASGTRLVAGLSAGFVMVDIESATVVDLVGPGSIGGLPGQEAGRLTGVSVAGMSYIGMGGAVPKPLATRLSDGQILLAKDINTHFIDINGEPLGRRQIPWSHAPAEIGYSYPYLLALHDSSKGVLEVRNPETLSLLQSISLPSASIMHIPQPNISLAHAGKGFLVSSDRVIWRMEALSYDTQIDALVEKGHLDEAISLLSMLEDALLKDKAGRLREIKLQKAQNLFVMRKYRDSMDLFTEVSAPPEAVIRLYPRLIAGDLSACEDGQDTPEPSITEGPAMQDGTQTEAEANGGEESILTKSFAYAPSVRSFLRTRADEASDSGSVRGKSLEDSAADKRLGETSDFRGIGAED